MATTTTPRRAFGSELTNSPTLASEGRTPRAFAKTPTTTMTPMTPTMGTPRGVDGRATPNATLTPRARSLITAQRALASPLRAAISPKASSGVKSSVKASDAATTRDVARLRELNSMLLKQLKPY